MTDHKHIAETSPAFTAVIKHAAPWWVGWIEELPGVNAQEATRDELIASLKEALHEAIALNREDARRAAGTGFSEVKISL